MNEQEMQAKIDGLTTELEDSKRARSGIDSKIQTLIAENSQLVAQLETASGEKVTATDALEAAAALQARRENVFNLAISNGTDPKATFALFGLSDADDEARFEALAGIKQDAKNEVLKANGRTPHETLKLDARYSLDTLERMSKSQLESLPPDVIEEAGVEMDKRENEARGRGTVRQRISKSLFGGE